MNDFQRGLLVASMVLVKTANAQTIAQECAIVNTIWQKMGKTTTFPSNCCDSYVNSNGISCSTTRVIRL